MYNYIGDKMRIIKYEDKYIEDVKRLLLELQEYVVSLDPYKYNILEDGYSDQVFEIDYKEVIDNDGVIFLAEDDDKIIGLIMGMIHKPVTEYDYVCPYNTGEVIELIVSRDARCGGVGKELLNNMEEYFKNKGCRTINIDVFGYNDLAIDFYNRRGYHNRMLVVSKKIGE